MSMITAVKTLAASSEACSQCGLCSSRCEVLDTMVPLTIGGLAQRFVDLARGFDLTDEASSKAYLEAVFALTRSDASLEQVVRRCCLCGACTVGCPDDIDAREVFASIRELFALSGVTTTEGFEVTQVDREWHIFSAYRVVYGIDYADLPHIAEAKEQAIDTLFFPGCPLVSYAPELCREVFSWLQDQGNAVAISEECCGSPLISAGFLERNRAFRENLAKSIADAGIKKMIFVCPGCMDEFTKSKNLMPDVEFVGLPQLLADANKKPLPDKVAELGAVAVYDSCHDRDQTFGKPIRRLLGEGSLCELPHAGKETRCCGAGGSVSLVDPELCTRRVQRVLTDGDVAGAQTMVANCPTCSYTFAAHKRSHGALSKEAPQTYNYLELMFSNGFEWDKVFANLEGMWTGEYGAWAYQQFFAPVRENIFSTSTI